MVIARSGLALVVLVLALAGTARAQGAIVEVRARAAPFTLSGTLLGPIAENGGIVVFGRELHTQAPRSIRVDASGISAGPSVDPMRVAAVARCGAHRWLLELEIANRTYRYSARPEGGAATWTAEMRDDSAPHVQLVCAGNDPLVGYLAGGELVIATPASPAPESRVRVMPPGGRGAQRIVPVDARAVLVLLAPWGAPPELLRIESGVITARTPTDAQQLEPLGSTRALVAHTERDGSLVLRVISSADLGLVASARISPPEAQHSLALAGAWRSPSGSIVIATTDQWLDGWVSFPQGANERDRYEPAHHSAAALRTMHPATGALGPSLPLGSEQAGVGGFIDGELVLIAGANVRSFRLAP